LNGVVAALSEYVHHSVRGVASGMSSRPPLTNWFAGGVRFAAVVCASLEIWFGRSSIGG
jgi:hypothetical protein